MYFGLYLGLSYHCSPPQGESPITPMELRETAKYKCNTGHMLQYLALALYLGPQDNRVGSRESKVEIKIQMIMQIC